jgi:hypothetical protein
MIIEPPSEQHRNILMSVDSGDARLHFSQLGEDCLIWHFYANIKNGTYVDVGCHHPFRYSNTALLYIFNNWTGLNIDADQRAIDLFYKYRPRDINVCCAVGNSQGSAEAFLFKDRAVNTLDPTRASRLIGDFGVPEKRTVDILPLSELLDRYLPAGTTIDLLNIDIEGFDHQAVESNDWQRYRPRLVCIETHNFNVNAPSDNPTFKHMHGVGYHMIAHIYATSVYQLKP